MRIDWTSAKLSTVCTVDLWRNNSDMEFSYSIGNILHYADYYTWDRGEDKKPTTDV